MYVCNSVCTCVSKLSLLHIARALLQRSSSVITHSLIELSLSWEAASCVATQELPSILFITVFTRVLHCSLS
jgi:hypothetical protein